MAVVAAQGSSSVAVGPVCRRRQCEMCVKRLRKVSYASRRENKWNRIAGWVVFL